MAAIKNLEVMAKSMSEHFHTVAKVQSSFEDDFTRFSRGIMRVIAGPLISHMDFNSEVAEPVILLDNACGSGVVTQEVQAVLSNEVLQRSSFTCADSSAAMVDLVKKRIASEKWMNVETKMLDAMNTGLPDNSFSHVAIALALHITPDPDAVVKDCMRILKPGGTFGASTWSKRNADIFWIPDMRSAIEALPFDSPFPDPMPMQMHRSGHWDDAAWIEKHLVEELGLTDVSVKETRGTYRFENAADFVACFGMMLPWVMSTFWSEEVRNAHSVDEVRELLRRHLDEKHGGEGWSIEWLVITMKGTVDE
ncbi:S-adenosyl-L-methionine-dependent methyltransferase [Trichoderma chlorosporum]